MRELATVTQRIPTKGTENDWLDAFAEYMRKDVAQGDASPETLRTYWSLVKGFLRWCASMDVDPGQITEDGIKEYRAHLIAQDLARSTIAGHLSAVRGFYRMAQARGYRPDNPAEGIKAPRDRTDPAAKVKWLPLGTVQQLLSGPDTSTPKGKRDLSMIMLMALHGLRVVEIHRLRLDDLDLDGQQITVTGKGGKVRNVHLVAETVIALSEWLAVRDECAASDAAAVFVSLRSGGNGNKGRSISRHGIRKMINLQLESVQARQNGKAGRQVSCHSLRHSFATLSLAAGAGLYPICRELGHSSIQTTQVYADIVDSVKQNPALFLIGALNGGEPCASSQ